MSKTNQPSMFVSDDLPLFSGTPQRAKTSEYKPKPVIRQTALVSCRWCFDTGFVSKNGKIYTCNCQHIEKE